MKRLVAAICLIAVAALASSALYAEEDETSRFVLIIVGTRKADDIKVIEKNLRELPYVTLFIPTSVSQRHIEYRGRLAGDEETLIADVESLAADRYDVKVKEGRGGIIITLRKIVDPFVGQ